MIGQSAMLDVVDQADAIAQDHAEYQAAVRIQRAGNPVLADSIDRILKASPEVEPAIARALEGYPHFD